MTVDKDGNEFTCEAGRAADFGGRWTEPCEIPYSENKHKLVTAIGDWDFCEPHMKQLIDAGLIDAPYVSEEGARHLVDEELRETQT